MKEIERKEPMGFWIQAKCMECDFTNAVLYDGDINRFMDTLEMVEDMGHIHERAKNHEVRITTQDK